MNDNLNIFQEERPWGNFRRFTQNEISTVKIVTVKKGEVLSLQSHQKRAEFWKVLTGDGFFEIGENKYEVKKGDEYFVKIGEKHRMGAENSILEVLEIAFGDFNENDIIRYEDKYGRT